MKNKTKYVVVTNDEYELPLLYADTAVEIAKIYGVTKDAIYKSIHRKRPFCRRYRVERFELEEQDES